VLLVNQSDVRCFGRVIPLAGCGFAAGILRGCDDFKISALQIFVDFLPAWQIKTASSPRGPGEDENFFAAEI
jgi:hypothetical protein